MTKEKILSLDEYKENFKKKCIEAEGKFEGDACVLDLAGMKVRLESPSSLEFNMKSQNGLIKGEIIMRAPFEAKQSL